MNTATKLSNQFLPFTLPAGAVLLLSVGIAARGQAADYLELPVVKPVIACQQLARAELSSAAGAAVTVNSATVVDSPKGPFCKVLGSMAPAIGFEVNLPMEHWTQRYAQGAQSNAVIRNAGSCMPAVNGEMVMATYVRSGVGRSGSWGPDLQKRIDWAYRGNHQTALVAKALIREFYGRPQRFAYFVGCSGGGREALIEAQRYPEDFDGISAGAPAAILNIHNGGFFHGWEAHVNRRADGSIVLARSRLGILHDAVVAHCAAPSGARDGILQQPTACSFDPAWVRCLPGTTNTANCLTAEETGVAQKLYAGSSDDAGRRFEMGGFPLGSELMWALSTPAGAGDAQSKPGLDLKYLLPFPESEPEASALDAKFAFNDEWFAKLGELAPLYNGANTNLRPFRQRGGKLIVWHGASDTSVQPALSIAYYQGVQKQLGVQPTDSFMRLFLLPGVAHCAGGDGPAQIDTLGPLMRWTELHQAPDVIVAGKPVNQASGIPAPPGTGVPNGGGGTARPNYPYSLPNQPAEFARPVYPFPHIARYNGKGDPKDAANYTSEKSSLAVPQMLDSRAASLIGPDNQKFYHVANGKLVAGNSR